MDWPRTIQVFLAILGTQCSNHLVRCKITDVRLVGGPAPNKGTVELQQDNGTWETTCGINLSINDVIVICRQLGFTGASRAIMNTPYRENSIPTKGLQCNDGVADLSECTLFSGSPCLTAGAASCHGEGYLGCFVNDRNNRVFPVGILVDDPSISISKCIQLCTESTTPEYTYAGVMDGDECYCGEANDNYARYGVVSGALCHNQCPADSTESCGGSGYIAVFTISMVTSTPATSPLTFRVPVETRTTTFDIGSSGSTNEVTSQVSLISSQKRMTSNEIDVVTTSSMTTVLLTTLPPSGHTSCLGVGVGEGVVIILLTATIIALVVYILRSRQKQRSINHGQNTHDMTLVKKTSSNDKDSSFYHGIHDVNPQPSTLTPQGDTQYSARIYGQHGQKGEHMKREETGMDADPYTEIV